jgi:hypothetical protein
MSIYKILPLVLGAALGAVIETGARPSSACACSCDDWVEYVAMEVEGSTSAEDQWLRSGPPIYLRVAGGLVMTVAGAPDGMSRTYPHTATSKGGAE